MKKRWFLLLPIAAVTLAGCSFLRRLIFGEESSSEPISYVFPEPVIEPDVPGRSIYKNFTYNLQDVLKTTNQIALPSTGNQKILLVPVQLRGTSSPWNSFKRDEIKKCFFGKSEEVGWESVSSYYSKASYGKLSITGVVADTFVSKYSFTELNAEAHPDRKIVDEFESSTAYTELRKEYDQDANGYVDSVAFIYSEPIHVTEDDMRWWAFVYTNNSSPDVNKPNVNTYMWASYYFSQKASSGNPHGGAYALDAHTYIHESGHLMGLDDYYSYDDNNKYDPSGGQEMHSQNIGDENIYSKLALGWINPYYVKTTESVTTTLYTSSFYSEGNAIIINDNWNGSPMDEYIILEYYSPTILNEKDSLEEYAKNAQMFDRSGFRIYHVDSRLVYYSKEVNSKYIGRTNGIATGYFNFVGASNTPNPLYSKLNDDDEIKDFKLLHFIQSGGVNTFKSGDKAVTADLFMEGSSFVASNAFFKNGTKFNSGNEVGYRITIDKCEPTFGTVTITKI